MEEDVEATLKAISSELSRFVPKKSSNPLLRLTPTTSGVISDEVLTEDEDWVDSSVVAGGIDRDLPPAVDFLTSHSGGLIAVDAGCIRLGEVDSGLVIALRAALIADDSASTWSRLYRTGPLFLPYAHKAEVFHSVGRCLGEADYYVELDDADPSKPCKVKAGVADRSVQYSDRFRALLERIVQVIAVGGVRNGTVLFDGSLTLRTRDCPDSHLRGLATKASKNGNAIVAISKTSDLLVAGRSVRFWLNDHPAQSCYRNLTPLLHDDAAAGHGRAERVLGNVYSARLSALGPTFRIDVKPPRGGTDAEALNQFFASAQMRLGYPDILVRAHALSYFSSQAVTQLQAQACAMFGLRPQPDQSLSATFTPFGGRFK